MAVQLTGVSKRYGGIAALRDVDFDVREGEVHALAGKNGAGKSTLIRILSGVESADSGTVRVGGELTRFRRPKDAHAQGIATVFQELSIVPQLSVAENISLGAWPRRRIGDISWSNVRRRAADALTSLAVPLDLDTPCGALSVAEQQLVEIARAISTGARVIILDEPTSSLPRHEVERLLTIVERLARQGVGIIYISHRLDEVRRLAHRVTVLRDGRLVGQLDREQFSVAGLTELMTGEPRGLDVLPRANPPTPTVRLRVTALASPARSAPLDLQVRKGEVLGVAGLLGSGRTELLRQIAGTDSTATGEVRVDESGPIAANVRARIVAGVALVPEDRRTEGLVFTTDIAENATMPRWLSARAGILNPPRIRKAAEEIAQRFGIKASSVDAPIGSLSGGNQQKVVIAKWASTGVSVLLLDQPTRGVDIHSKEQIYAIIRQLADEGMSIIFVSDEFEEFKIVCDRVIVIKDGSLIGEMDAADADETALMTTIAGEAA